MYNQANKITKLISSSNKILVIQADNPDADSLGSALTLENILADMKKQVNLFCSVDMPKYLHYLSGWDRVEKELKVEVDLVIFVDVSTYTLLDKLVESKKINQIKNIPTIVLDHHEIVENKIDYAEVVINDPKRASTGELIYFLAKQLNWELNIKSLEFILNTILGDTQGLTNNLAKADTYRIIADMIDYGVDRPKLEELRREYTKMTESIFRFKGELIKKVILENNNKIAYVKVNQEEINKYSPDYNPAPLIHGDMLSIEGVVVAIVFKVYASGKVTGSIRTNQKVPIANLIAEHLGGGGHSFASGFKEDKTDNSEEIIKRCLDQARSLLQNYTQ